MVLLKHVEIVQGLLIKGGQGSTWIAHMAGWCKRRETRRCIDLRLTQVTSAADLLQLSFSQSVEDFHML